MKILSMELENFRQYYGKQTIDFSSDFENITILFGENGKGKTGIYRALMFALYDATHIEQDNPNEPIHLVNLKLLEENKGSVCRAKVTIKFEHRDKQYELTRSIAGLQRGSQIQERRGDVQLYEIDEAGNYSPTPIDDPHHVQQTINNILDEDIKDFFLFDGEKIDTLAKTNEEIKKEVKTAIFKLLQIEDVEEAIQLLNQLKRNEQRTVIQNTTDVNAKGKQDEIDAVEEEINSLTEQLVHLREEERATEDLIQTYELQLSESKEISEIQKQLELHKTTLNALQEHATNIQQQIAKTLLTNMPFVLMKDPFNNVANYLQGFVSEQDHNVPIEVIEQSLKDGVCACCNNDLNVHQENLAFVELLKQNYQYSNSNETAKHILNMIHDKQQMADDVKEEALQLLKDYTEKTKEIREAETDINTIKQQIGKKAEEQLHLQQTNEALENEQQYLEDIRKDIARTELRLEDLEKQLEKLRDELDEIIRANEHKQFEQKVIDMINDLNDDIQGIATEFSIEMRDHLTNTTTETFRKIIDEKDIDLIEEIRINDKFELEIMNHNGVEITQDISQGQRQMVALAFITSLALVAAGDQEKISFPLFMDSPFNRLSGKNRDSLINHIPNLTSQWILLLTDTELTTSEERVIKEKGRLGKWYRLNQVEKYHTIIEEVPLHETLTTRGL